MNDNGNLVRDLKLRGVRVTPQRAIILEAIEQLPGHMTAEEIYNAVQAVNAYISLATVYRTLDLLREMGLVTEARMGTTTVHYALKDHANHHHAVCRNCKHSYELPDDLFAPIVERSAQRPQLRGRCGSSGGHGAV
ncbi:MAG: transcriptional repressor [Caldilineaceae bacterium]